MARETVERPRVSIAARLPRGLTLVVCLVLVSYIFVIFLRPLVEAFLYSVNDTDVIAGRSRFVGTQNFARIASDGSFWSALRVASLFTLF